MRASRGFVVLMVYLVCCFASALPKQEDRVKEQKLSDEKHFEDGIHNPEYDHEAFLGKEEAEAFDKLSPEESKEKLGLIYDKIDKDQNGEVSEEELTDWIRYVQKKYIIDDVDRQWPTHDVDKDDKLSWNEYKKTTYGYEEGDEGENDTEGQAEGFSYREMLTRDKKRWSVADVDGDSFLTKEEFTAFLHPEDADHMKDVVVEETMLDIDKDKDGFVSLEEYIGDMYHEAGAGGGDSEKEPDWVKTEREQFSSFRDKDKDGKMDKSEVKDWIIPPDYDHALAEARHLIYESDENKDKKLTKEEVLSKTELFVGSQATDFGEALTRHDEF